MEKKKKIKRNIAGPVLAILSVVGIIYCSFMGYLNWAITPVDSTDTELHTVELESYGLNGIAKELKEQEIIKNPLAFVLRAQLSGTAGQVNSGTFYLSKNMDVDKIISILGKGDNDNTTTTSVRISEGDTIEDIAEKLYEANVIYDKEAFLNECKTGGKLLENPNYEYLTTAAEEGNYVLEGYLFPDTYDFYFNSKPEDVIVKMLNRFNELYTAELQMLATQKGFTTKDVVTLASIIQKEGNEFDFAKVSAVLNNRLSRDMYLQCDSTIRYITNLNNTMSLTEEQYSYDSLYNTYENKGIIPSPICSPSLAAITAVLQPDQEYVDGEYLYFCSTDSSNSELVFAQTYQDHLANVKKYKEYWEAYDETVKNN